MYDGIYEFKTGFTPEENYLQSTTQLFEEKYVYFGRITNSSGATNKWIFSTGSIDHSRSRNDQPGLSGGYDSWNDVVMTNPSLVELSLGIDGISTDNSWPDVTSTVTITSTNIPSTTNSPSCTVNAQAGKNCDQYVAWMRGDGYNWTCAMVASNVGIDCTGCVCPYDMLPTPSPSSIYCGKQVGGDPRAFSGVDFCTACYSNTFAANGESDCKACKVCLGGMLTACTGTTDTFCQSNSTTPSPFANQNQNTLSSSTTNTTPTNGPSASSSSTNSPSPSLNTSGSSNPSPYAYWNTPSPFTNQNQNTSSSSFSPSPTTTETIFVKQSIIISGISASDFNSDPKVTAAFTTSIATSLGIDATKIYDVQAVGSHRRRHLLSGSVKVTYKVKVTKPAEAKQVTTKMQAVEPAAFVQSLQEQVVVVGGVSGIDFTSLTVTVEQPVTVVQSSNNVAGPSPSSFLLDKTTPSSSIDDGDEFIFNELSAGLSLHGIYRNRVVVMVVMLFFLGIIL